MTDLDQLEYISELEGENKTLKADVADLIKRHGEDNSTFRRLSKTLEKWADKQALVDELIDKLQTTNARKIFGESQLWFSHAEFTEVKALIERIQGDT